MFKLKNFINLINKTMTIKDLLSAVNSLNELSTEKLPVVVSFKIAKLTKAISDELEIFNKTRTKMIKELGESKKDKNGKENWKVKKENIETWNEAYKDLINTKVDIKVPEITIEELGDVRLSPSILSGLLLFIK